MIDFHCHLDLFPDPASAAATADEAGLYVLSVTTTPKAFIKTAGLAKGRKRIKTALGLHPEIAHQRKGELNLFDRLVGETKYVGEVGLDRSAQHVATFRDQELVFNHILATCCRAGGRIVSIHSRGAATEVLDALESHPGFGTPVLHWFSGSAPQLRRASEMGCWFSVGAPMVRSAKGRSLISHMPKTRVLTETDAPFTSPASSNYAGASIAQAVEGLAELWGMTVGETDKQLTRNLRSLVSKPGLP